MSLCIKIFECFIILGFYSFCSPKTAFVVVPVFCYCFFLSFYFTSVYFMRLDAVAIGSREVLLLYTFAASQQACVESYGTYAAETPRPHRVACDSTCAAGETNGVGVGVECAYFSGIKNGPIADSGNFWSFSYSIWSCWCFF